MKMNQTTRRRCSGLIAALISVTMLFAGLLPMTGGSVSAASELPCVTTAYNGKSPYYVMVNRQMNTVTVYGVGSDGNYSVPVKAMIASCGRSGHSTPLGTYSTPDSRYVWRLMVDGSYGHYASRINGGIMFHSVCFKSAKSSTLMTEEYDMLGGVASLGCVRLQVIDAKWIYDNCPTGTLVTIYDSSDPGALGKPQKAVDSIASSPNSNWDPTDPDSSNPWRLQLDTTVRGTGSGTLTGAGAYRYGDTASLTAVPDEHSAFDGWYDGETLVSAEPTCSVPVLRQQNINAWFHRLASVTATASASGTTEGSGNYEFGSTVTVTTSAKDDAAFLGWYDRYGNELSQSQTYSFMAESDHEIYAMYDGDLFADVAEDAWYRDTVREAVEENLTSGMTPVLFEPSGSFTRAMAVQMIARVDGADTAKAKDASFTDVASDAWYAQAVNWASENGIAAGVGDNLFAPDQTITRQEMLTMMGRYITSKDSRGIEEAEEEENKPEAVLLSAWPDTSEVLLTYADVDEIADYAVEWFRFAENYNLIKGYEDNTVRPTAVLTRAEGVTLMLRMKGMLYEAS